MVLNGWGMKLLDGWLGMEGWRCFERIFDYSSNNGFSNLNWGEFFTRTLLDREVVMLRILEDMVRSMELVLEVEDRLSWVHDCNREFTVMKLSNLLIKVEQVGTVVFSMANQNGNEMASTLAITGINRGDMFKAY
ncbi:hypothetical protein Gotri_014009 [Gossypium trilobum]|uniref:Uncharacterized protein n=1 Tax=Gossypium trilobum TaxID=34281 RepID=A0A7J9DWI3_9ROSI|nr:hypothetical protein [Gossypium trilobum]